MGISMEYPWIFFPRKANTIARLLICGPPQSEAGANDAVSNTRSGNEWLDKGNGVKVKRSEFKDELSNDGEVTTGDSFQRNLCVLQLNSMIHQKCTCY